MPEFYHDLITEKSFRLLQTLRRKYDFTLIGGWAVFLYTKSLKSKDVDIIISYETLGKLKRDFELIKNERLKKYEIKVEEIDVDVYLPHYSNLGLPAEEIQKNTKANEGFILPTAEILLILKTYALKQRAGTAKGRKDLLDIFSLLAEQTMNRREFKKLVEQYDLKSLTKELKTAIQEQTAIPELGLSEHKLARLKKKTLAELSPNNH